MSPCEENPAESFCVCHSHTAVLENKEGFPSSGVTEASLTKNEVKKKKSCLQPVPLGASA